MPPPNAAAAPRPVVLDDVVAARDRIGDAVRRTPVLAAPLDTIHGSVEVVFKLEFTQLGGCFKPRGSINAVLAAREEDALGEAGVLVASGGNAAIGAAWAARIVGVGCTVVVPETVPQVKADTLRGLGATVHLIGERYQQAADAAAGLAADSGALLLHAYDLPDIAAGAGTIGLELIDDVAGPLTTAVCVGGGGLLGGLTATLRPGDRLVGVEPVGSACLYRAVAAGGPVTVHPDSVAADSLGASRIGDTCWATVGHRTGGAGPVDTVVVTDDEILAARRMMWDRFRIVIEAGTATAVAGVVTGRVVAAPGTTLCVVLCGANTSPTA